MTRPMNSFAPLALALALGLVLCSLCGVSMTVVGQSPPTLTQYYWNIECTGAPFQTFNYPLTAGGTCTDGVYPFVDPSGEFIYWYSTGLPCGEPGSTGWTSITREPVGLTINHGANTCSNYVIENAANAYPQPLSFPPVGWLLNSQNLNVTTGQPTKNCHENERVLIGASALGSSVCYGGQQSYCQASPNQTTATQAIFNSPDLNCKQPTTFVSLSTLNQECVDGQYYSCSSEDTIPAVDFHIAYYEYDSMGANNCTTDMGTVTLLYDEGACIIDDDPAGTIYSCEPNGTITVTEYINSQTSPSCTIQPGTTTRVFNYPVDTCIPLPYAGGYSNFVYTCNYKPTPPSTKSSTSASSATRSIFESVPPQSKKKKKKQILTESSI